jgi:hypothetical protein
VFYNSYNYIKNFVILSKTLFSPVRICICLVVYALFSHFKNTGTAWQHNGYPIRRAAETVAQGVRLYQQGAGKVTIWHVSRTVLTQPHTMANWACTTSTTFTGTIPAEVVEKTNIQQVLNRDHLRRTSQH